ncbi:MAG: multidrug efflux system membrane fusion protein [Paraglaciecola sp.]|jgi:multidrug efflux system membrane fusion protein
MKTVWIKIALPIVVLAIGFGGMKAIEASAPEEEEKEALDTRPTVTIETALAEDYQVKITSFGEVKPLESTLLSAQVSGEVRSWHPNFVPGGLVLLGDTLFSIEKDTYQAAQLQAEANLSLAESQLIEEQARADVAKQEAKNLSQSKVSDLYLRKPQLMSAKAAVKSAQSKLNIAQRDLKNCDVTAPYDALVITRNIGVGQYVNQGAQVAELYNIETAEITFPIAGFDRAFLPAGIADKMARVSTNGYNAITREGLISRDLGIIDQSTRMSQLVVRVEDPYSLKSDLPPLKFGSYVEVSFAGKTLRKIYRLPQDLVTNRIVWVVDDEQQLQPQQVNIVREEGEYFLISKGVQEQDKVVTTLPEYPQKGMKVKIAQPDKDLLVQQAL